MFDKCLIIPKLLEKYSIFVIITTVINKVATYPVQLSRKNIYCNVMCTALKQLIVKLYHRDNTMTSTSTHLQFQNSVVIFSCSLWRYIYYLSHVFLILNTMQCTKHCVPVHLTSYLHTWNVFYKPPFVEHNKCNSCETNCKTLNDTWWVIDVWDVRYQNVDVNENVKEILNKLYVNFPFPAGKIRRNDQEGA